MTQPATRKTVVSIAGQAFHINGQPTYPGRTYNGMKIEGLLMNVRLVQGIFDDENPQTRKMWAYPDGPFDPERNTREFIAMMPQWYQQGMIAFTINLQGGSPQGYSNSQPWINSGLEWDGRLKPAYMQRLEKVLDKADELGMVVILGYYYFGQEPRMIDEAAIKKGAENITTWLLEKGYTNVIVEIANECNVRYIHPLIRPERVHELIEQVQKQSTGHVANPHRRLLVSVSYGGGSIPKKNVVEIADFILLHGNGQSEPSRIAEMVQLTRQVKGYHNQPVLFNEDDHFNFDQPENNMTAAVSQYAGWGYFDFRMKDEGLDEGYQSLPTNWQTTTVRKKGFFTLLEKMTGGLPGQ